MVLKRGSYAPSLNFLLYKIYVMYEILIIDDNWKRGRKEIYESVLLPEFNIQSAENGDEVFIKIEQYIEQVDIIIVDIVLSNWVDINTNEPLNIFPVLKKIGTEKNIILVSNEYGTLIKENKLSLLMNSIIQDGYNVSNFIIWEDFISAKRAIDNPLTTSVDYKASIRNRIKLEILKVEKKEKEKKKTNASIGIIAALDVELKPFIDYFSTDLLEPSFNKGPYNVQKGYIKTISNKQISFVVAKQEKMGMVDAAFLVSTLILECNIKHVFMIGVCGGRNGFVEIGDIIIPDDSVAYQNGKINQNGFEAEIEVSNCNSHIKQHLSKAYTDTLLAKLSSQFETMYKEKSGKTTGLSTPNIHYDSMACGDVIVNLAGEIDRIAEHSSKRKLCSIEMESFSVLRANNIFSNLGIKSTIVKSVMDLASHKSDIYKEYAAYMSANFLVNVLKDEKYNIG